MTNAIQTLTIFINDDASINVQASDASTSGHTYAIAARPIGVTTLRAAAAALGLDVASGVENRLMMLRTKLRERIKNLEMYQAELNRARTALALLEVDLNIPLLERSPEAEEPM